MQYMDLDEVNKKGYAKREAFNSLRTNLSFCGDDIKVMVFTSCTPDEGKSSTVMGLAIAYAEAHKKVLVINGDLRKPVVYDNIYNSGKAVVGISDYLLGREKLKDVLTLTGIENFHIVPAGRPVQNPTELLGNDRFKQLLLAARKVYDIILIDSPPLGYVIDTAVIAPYCDGAVLLVESSKNSYRLLQNTKKQLEMTGVRILGVVLNKVKVTKSRYSNRYYENYYKKYYGEMTE